MVKADKELKKMSKVGWSGYRRQQLIKQRELQAKEESIEYERDRAAENAFGIKRKYRGGKLGFF